MFLEYTILLCKLQVCLNEKLVKMLYTFYMMRTDIIYASRFRARKRARPGRHFGRYNMASYMKAYKDVVFIIRL